MEMTFLNGIPVYVVSNKEKRRRTWKERWLSRPWRPWVKWVKLSKVYRDGTVYQVGNSFHMTEVTLKKLQDQLEKDL